jgi:hypothetical protein
MQQEPTPFFKAQEIFLIFFEQIPDYVDRVTAEVIAKENALNTVRLILNELYPQRWGSESEKAMTRYNYYTEVEDQLELFP